MDLANLTGHSTTKSGSLIRKINLPNPTKPIRAYHHDGNPKITTTRIDHRPTNDDPYDLWQFSAKAAQNPPRNRQQNPGIDQHGAGIRQQPSLDTTINLSMTDTGGDGLDGMDDGTKDKRIFDPDESWMPTRHKGGMNMPVRKHRFGLKLVRDHPNSQSGYSMNDMKRMLVIIKNIDPLAVVLDHNNDPKSAIPITTLIGDLATKPQDLKAKFDMTTKQWGKRQESKDRTQMVIYLTSDVITPDMKALRENTEMATFMGKGNIRLASTRLHSSDSKCVAYVFGKEPDHTYRDEMANRLECFLEEHGSTVSVMCNTQRLKGKEYDTSMVGIFVATMDFTTVKSLLMQHEHPEFQFLYHDQKRLDIDTFTAGMKQHDMICSDTRAFKMTHVIEEDVDELRKIVYHHTGSTLSDPIVMDISKGRMPGVVYIQYLNTYKVKVLEAMEFAAQELRKSTNTEYPAIWDPGASVAMTKATAAGSAATTKNQEQFPALRFPKSITTTTTRPPVTRAAQRRPNHPLAIDLGAKSFSDAVQATTATNTATANATVTTSPPAAPEPAPTAAPDDTDASTLSTDNTWATKYTNLKAYMEKREAETKQRDEDRDKRDEEQRKIQEAKDNERDKREQESIQRQEDMAKQIAQLTLLVNALTNNVTPATTRETTDEAPTEAPALDCTDDSHLATNTGHTPHKKKPRPSHQRDESPIRANNMAEVFDAAAVYNNPHDVHMQADHTATNHHQDAAMPSPQDHSDLTESPPPEFSPHTALADLIFTQPEEPIGGPPPN